MYHGESTSSPQQKEGPVSREDVAKSQGLRDERAGGDPSSIAQDPPDLTADEQAVLRVLVSHDSARTVAQLCAGCGLSRERVVPALDGLRGKGLVTRHNTLVESYAARFPGMAV
jgi:DNA-binding MarR family transcriptional regulator